MRGASRINPRPTYAVRTWGLLLALALAGTARAQAAESSAPSELTLEQALAMARHANASLIVERARLKQAQVNLEQAWTVLFPTVTAQGKYSRNNAKFEFPSMTGAQADTLTIQPKNQLDGVISFSTLR